MSRAMKSQQKVTITFTRAQATQLANAADRRLTRMPYGPDRTALDCAYEALDAALRTQSDSNTQHGVVP